MKGGNDLPGTNTADFRQSRKTIQALLEQKRTVRLPFRGGSMRYTIPAGSQVVVAPPAGLRPGHVCLYQVGDVLIAHRLIRIAGSGTNSKYIFRGELPVSEDETIPGQDVIGRIVAVVHGGRRYDLSGSNGLAEYLWLRRPALIRSSYRFIRLMRSAWRRAVPRTAP